MIKISGKTNKPNTDNRFNFSFFIGNRTSSDSTEVLFPIKDEILNPLSVFCLFIFPLIFIAHTLSHTHTHTHIYIYIYIYISLKELFFSSRVSSEDDHGKTIKSENTLFNNYRDAGGQKSSTKDGRLKYLMIYPGSHSRRLEPQISCRFYMK